MGEKSKRGKKRKGKVSLPFVPESQSTRVSRWLMPELSPRGSPVAVSHQGSVNSSMHKSTHAFNRLLSHVIIITNTIINIVFLIIVIHHTCVMMEMMTGVMVTWNGLRWMNMMRHITMMWMMLELNNDDDHEGDLKVHMGLRIISVKINKLYISYNIRLVLYNVVYTILYNVVWANNSGYS